MQQEHRLARWKDGKYEAPTTANSACILILHLAEFVRCRAIMRSDQKESDLIKDLIYLMQKNQNADITKVANVNRVELQRGKIEKLPNTSEIHSLISSLEEKIQTNYKLLLRTFSIDTFCALSQLTLVYLLVFNRKRPGDCERTLISDYQNMVGVSDDIYSTLSPETQQFAKKFMRFIS